MAEGEAKVSAEEGPSTDDTKHIGTWLDLLKVVALPLVTLILGFVFNASLNSRQERENNVRLYADMMGRREEADSSIRRDMFKSVLDTFMRDDPHLSPYRKRDQHVLNLELLAYNFHESLDLGPLFKYVRREIPNHPKNVRPKIPNQPKNVRRKIPNQSEDPDTEMLNRLERVASEVNERQLTVLSDGGMVERGDAQLQKVSTAEAFLIFGPRTVADSSFRPGEGASRLCLSMYSTADSEWHHRQFKLELTEFDPRSRELRVRLYVSKILNSYDCHQSTLNLVDNREVDTKFWVGLFDFPMIDNTRLSHSERCSVSVTSLTSETPYAVKIGLAYFPGSRASLKDKPFYDDLLHDLLSEQKPAAERQPSYDDLIHDLLRERKQ